MADLNNITIEEAQAAFEQVNRLKQLADAYPVLKKQAEKAASENELSKRRTIAKSRAQSKIDALAPLMNEYRDRIDAISDEIKQLAELWAQARLLQEEVKKVCNAYGFEVYKHNAQFNDNPADSELSAGDESARLAAELDNNMLITLTMVPPEQPGIAVYNGIIAIRNKELAQKLIIEKDIVK